MLRRSLPRLFAAGGWIVPVVLLGVLGSAAPEARAAPRLYGFSCHFGSGRTHVLVPRQREEDATDEMSCRARVAGLGGRSARDLGFELRILAPDGSHRVVATGLLEPADERRDRARIVDLYVPHASWASAVDWRNKAAPRVRLELRVLDKPAPGDRRWRFLVSRRLDLGGPGAIARDRNRASARMASTPPAATQGHLRASPSKKSRPVVTRVGKR